MPSRQYRSVRTGLQATYEEVRDGIPDGIHQHPWHLGHIG
jgi:hypothetical protein